MRIAVKIVLLAGVSALTALASPAAAAAFGPTGIVALWHQDSSEKQTQEQNPPQPSAQEKPAREKSEEKGTQAKPSQHKPAQEPPAPGKPADNPQSQPAANPSESAPTESPNAAPSANQEGSQAQSANPTSQASPSPTPETQAGAPATPTGTAATHKPSPAVKESKPQNGATPSKRRIIREGGTSDASALLAPSMTAEQASHQRENTTKLLNSADVNLQKIAGRQLKPDQQATVDQIRAYMQQAKEALNRGDLQRSHNLALKANLLSEDLAKH